MTATNRTTNFRRELWQLDDVDAQSKFQASAGDRLSEASNRIPGVKNEPSRSCPLLGEIPVSFFHVPSNNRA